jgi:hypothetical protein
MRTKSKLPRRITLLLWLVLIITTWNLIRLITGIAWRDTLEAYAAKPGPFYIGFTGALWSGIGIFLFWSFIRGSNWTRISILVTGFIYATWIWADRLFVQSQLHANWPFDLLVTLILLSFMTAVVLDPSNQIYFLKRDL